MPKIVDEQEQKARILVAAARAFASHGLATTSMDEVAREAGLSRPGIYTYYPDRQTLIDELVCRVVEQERELFHEVLVPSGGPGTGTAIDRLEELARRLGMALFDAGPVGSIMIQLWAHRPADMRDLLADVRQMTAEALRAGVQTGELGDLGIAAAARAIVGLWDGILLQHFLEPGLVDSAVALGQELAAGVRPLLYRAS